MGVEKTVVKEGTGAAVVRGQRVTVHCTGFGENPYAVVARLLK